eukprot:PhM_4_TR5279/c0_g1_i1/m.98966
MLLHLVAHDVLINIFGFASESPSFIALTLIHVCRTFQHILSPNCCCSSPTHDNYDHGGVWRIAYVSSICRTSSHLSDAIKSSAERSLFDNRLFWVECVKRQLCHRDQNHYWSDSNFGLWPYRNKANSLEDVVDDVNYTIALFGLDNAGKQTLLRNCICPVDIFDDENGNYHPFGIDRRTDTKLIPGSVFESKTTSSCSSITMVPPRLQVTAGGPRSHFSILCSSSSSNNIRVRTLIEQIMGAYTLKIAFLVFVIDSSDVDRFGKSVATLIDILQHHTQSLPLLILLNKSDLAQSRTAHELFLEEEDLCSELSLSLSKRTGPWWVQSCDVRTSSGRSHVKALLSDFM